MLLLDDELGVEAVQVGLDISHRHLGVSASAYDKKRMRVEDERIGEINSRLHGHIEAIIPGVVHHADDLQPAVRICDGRSIWYIQFQSRTPHRLANYIASARELLDEGAID